MIAHTFHLPDVGEGLQEAEIITWRVAVGDTITHNQPLLEIETAKSRVELPSPYKGVVAELLVNEGQTVPVGTPIISVDSKAVSDETDNVEPRDSDSTSTGPRVVSGPAPSVLVGYGPTETCSTRRRRRRPSADLPPHGIDVCRAQEPTRAKPPVRKLAKDLGVDLTVITGSGPHDTINRGDVVDAAKRAAHAAQPATTLLESALPTVLANPAPDSGADAPETRIPVKGVRKATATAMSASAFTAPHATEFLTVDVTRSVRLVEKLKPEPAFDGSRVTMLLLVARALLAAAREHPGINASWDDQTDEIVLYHQLNLGIATATPRGLMVPNIKDAGALSLPQLAAALTDLVQTARDGKLRPEDMSRGTITITNIGVFGVDAGTPILNPGEAAILCFGAVRQTPWEHKGKVALRWTTQLALSFDHRLVDGELGSKVLSRIGTILADPKWELLLC